MSRYLSLEEDSEVFTASISTMCAKFYENSSEKDRRTDSETWLDRLLWEC